MTDDAPPSGGGHTGRTPRLFFDVRRASDGREKETGPGMPDFQDPETGQSIPWREIASGSRLRGRPIPGDMLSPPQSPKLWVRPVLSVAGGPRPFVHLCKHIVRNMFRCIPRLPCEAIIVMLNHLYTLNNNRGFIIFKIIIGGLPDEIAYKSD